jgi:hypothetical protein
VIWSRCQRKLAELSDEGNEIAAEMVRAMESRSGKLMENLALASAVFIDPRLHHKTSSKKLLGDFESEIEVISHEFALN